MLRTEVLVSPREAWDGLVGSDRRARFARLCRHCGGRGETWTEPCGDCRGTGALLVHHAVRVTLPPGVADGARFRFRVSSPGADSVRVEVCVLITNRVIE